MKGERPTKLDLPERTFEFARRAVVLCRELDQAPCVSRTLATQLLRSATSLRLLVAADIVPARKLEPLIDEANQLIAILTTIVKKTRKPRAGGAR